MTNLKAAVVMSFTDKISAPVKKVSKNIGNLEKHTKKLGKSFSKLKLGLGSIATTAGLAALAKQVGDTEEKFVRLGIAFRVPKKEMNDLKKTIFKLGVQWGVSANNILGGVQAIATKTGDLDFAEKNVKALTVAIQATGVAGSDLGELFSTFQQIGVSDALKALDTLNKQGKSGSFTLQKFAAFAPRLLSLYASLGRGAEKTVKEVGGLAQVFIQGTGSAEVATSSLKAAITELASSQVQKKLSSLGVNVVDSAGKFRSIPAVLEDTVKKTGGNLTKLGSIFGRESLSGIAVLAQQFKRTGDFKGLDKFLKIAGNGVETLKDAKTASRTFNASMRKLGAAFTFFANTALTPIIDKIAVFFGKLTPEKLQSLAKTFVAVIGGITTAFVALRAAAAGAAIAAAFASGGASIALTAAVLGATTAVAGGVFTAFLAKKAGKAFAPQALVQTRADKENKKEQTAVNITVTDKRTAVQTSGSQRAVSTKNLGSVFDTTS